MALRLQGRHYPRSPVTAHLGASKHPLCKAACPDPRPWGEVSALWAALLGLTDQQRSPGSRAHPGAGLWCRRPDWSLPGDRTGEIPEKRPTPRTKLQAGCLVGPRLQGRGRPHGGASAHSTEHAGARALQMASGVEGSGCPGQRGPGPAWRHGKRQGATCRAPHEAGPRFPAGLAGGFAQPCPVVGQAHAWWRQRASDAPPASGSRLQAPEGPDHQVAGGVIPPPFGQQRRGRRAGTWCLPEGVGLETPEDILTSLPSFCLPGSDSLLTSPARPRIFPIV